MTQEEKQLLLKDLCARLPYGVKCRFETTVDTYRTIELSREGTNGLLVDFDELYCYWFNEGFIIPYLRPMSSMTEEEKEEFQAFHCIDGWHPYFYQQMCNIPNLENMFNWLNAHHFDYRGLIPMGLALEATEGTYKTE